MKKYCYIIAGILIGIGITFIILNFCQQCLNYKDVDIAVKIFTGVAPFVAAFGAYYMWYTNRDYKNDFYQKVLDKRLNSYELLEKIVYLLACLSINEGKCYHVYFSNAFFSDKLNTELLNAVSHNMWFSEEINDNLQKLNKIIYHLPNSDYEKQTYAVEKFNEVSNIRTNIISYIERDLIDMYEVKDFIMAKSIGGNIKRKFEI